MEAFRQCSDLNARLQNELRLRRVTLVTQDDSRLVLERIARALGVSSSIVNLFPVEAPLSTAEYIYFVNERIKAFASAAAEEPDLDAVFANDNESKTLGGMAAQMEQWQRDHAGVTAASTPTATGATEDSDGGGSDSGDSDGEDSDDSASEASGQRKDDDDDGSDDDTAGQKDEPVAPADATALANGLLEDKARLGKFTSEAFSLINPRGEGKVDFSGTQPFIDRLVEQGFEPARLRRILSSFLREHNHLRDLSYSQFSYYVRFILQRYVE